MSRKMIKQMGKTDEDFDDGKMMVRYFKNVIENHDVDIEKDGTWAKACLMSLPPLG